MKKLLSIIFLILITSSIYGQIPSYYNGLDLSKTGNDLFLELATRITDTHSGIPYTGSPVDVWDACKEADEDPDISANVLLIYGFDDFDGVVSTDRTRDKTLQDTGSGASGVWNREHVFAQSLALPPFGTSEPGPGTDVHNLRPADRERNGTRSNRFFTNGSGVDSYIASDGGWYPGDEWKGDVARIIMYMYTRYHGDGTQVSEQLCLPSNIGFGTVNNIDQNMIDLFLEWNVEDEVSTFEADRNEVLAGIQGNRNPFIDNPYLATIIWEGLTAEDKWDMGGSSDAEAPSAPTNLMASNITDESFDVSWTASTDNIGVYDYLVYLDGIYLQTATTITTSILNLSPNTSYTITIKARDTASNLSEFSVALNETTLEGPKILLAEDFEDCVNTQFFTYNEASDKNWGCETQFGENNSGSYGINGYLEDVASKDWLITNNPVNFDNDTGEKISFYTDAAYGTTPLELLYSSDYDGSSNPSNYAWIPVPNITIPTHSNGSSTEEVYMFTDEDISAINGTVYFAFKYYSDGVPTRWTVDSFEIIADNDNPDIDGDGVLNVNDNCPDTANADQLDADGDGVGNVCDNCPSISNVDQVDSDNDGIGDVCDNCPDMANADQVDSDFDGIGDTCDTCTGFDDAIDADSDGIPDGCDICPGSDDSIDTDGDGVPDGCDICPGSDDAIDADGDGIPDGCDNCLDTANADQADTDGDGVGDVCDTCPGSDDAIDTDGDGVPDGCDICPGSDDAIDADGDGIPDGCDNCPDTANVDQADTDGDGVGDVCDICPGSDDAIDTDGDGVPDGCDICPDSDDAIDADGDGIPDGCDNCPGTANVDQADTDGDGVGDVCDTCPGFDDALDADGDGIPDDCDICPGSDDAIDTDSDGIPDGCDNCPDTANADQADTDGDGVGDVCDTCPGSDDAIDTDGDGVPDGCDICPGSDDAIDTDGDGIPDGCDNCPDTANADQADTDTDGIGNACDSTPNGDDDNDGVDNLLDQCPGTTAGVIVDATGCFTLVSDNFEIEVISETCPNKDNGQIVIASVETHDYETTINGSLYNFTDNLTVTDLTPGVYDFCIAVTGESYEQCYTVKVIEGTTVSGKSSVASGKASIEIEQGTAPFTIYVNGKEIIETNAPIFNIDVKHGDIVEVKTAVSCEGVYSKTIALLDELVAYPNPTNGVFDIALPVSQKEVTIELYTIHSQLISRETYPIVYGKVQLTLENQPVGVYIAKVQLDKPVTLKIIKQ